MTTNIKFQRNIASLLLSFSAAAVMAQTSNLPAGEGEYRHDDALETWRLSENSAGLTIDSLRDRGYAAFSFFHRSGDYHRVQEGKQTNNLTFFTERYQHIGKYLYGYGRFRFDDGRTTDRAWSDVMRTYQSDPFISGSSVPGRYDTQQFDMGARLGTISFSGWRFGIGLDYRVGDLSRLRDPRSRSRYLDYKIKPGVIYSFGRHDIGLTGWYRRYKEKIPNITTVQNDPNLYYYQMSGLEAAVGAIGSYQGYQREYVDHEFGAELEYGYQGESLRNVTTVSISRGSEEIYEQYKREPGHYTTYDYQFSSHFRILSNGLIHQIDLGATAGQAYADEYRPQMVITTDSVHGWSSTSYKNLLTYKKRFQQKTATGSLHYRLNFTDGNSSVHRYAGVSGAFTSLSQKHLLPTSKWNYNTTDWTLEYGEGLFKQSLWLSAEYGRHYSTKADLRLADESTIYAQNVLFPDQNYYTADYGHVTLLAKYQFPLTVKGFRSRWYVEAWWTNIHAQHGLKQNTFGVSAGIFY